ncbi:MAG: ATP-binding protein, partial [Verrucomicrobiota bacterium]
QARNLYRMIALEGGDIPFSVGVSSGCIIWAKDLPANMLGYDENELDLQPDTFEQVLHEEDREAFFKGWKRLADGCRLNLDVRLMTKSGNPVWVQIIAIADTEPGERAAHQAIGIVRNTEAQHQAATQAARERQNEALGTIAGGMAHEFNNHLTPVRGYIELALDYLGNDHPVSDGLQTAQDQVDYCTGLIEQIQVYGGTSILMKEHVDLTSLIPSALQIALSGNRAREAKITVNQVHPNSLQTVMADKTQIRQAIVQLVRNSVAAMSEGGTLTVETSPVSIPEDEAVRTDERDMRSGNMVCLKVTDTGIGIQPEILERIFDPFFSTQRAEGARGMGLPMVKGAVAQHDGWLEIDSTPGEGTEVRIFLPMSQPYSQSHPEDKETMTVLPAASVGNILIADDEDHIRKLIRKVFNQEGWDTDEASDYE